MSPESNGPSHLQTFSQPGGIIYLRGTHSCQRIFYLTGEHGLENKIQDESKRNKLRRLNLVLKNMRILNGDVSDDVGKSYEMENNDEG